MDHNIISTIEDTEDNRAVFNLLVEYVAEYIKDEYEETVEMANRRSTESALEAGVIDFDPHNESDVSLWLQDWGLSKIESRINTFDEGTWLQALDGEIATRGPEVMGQTGFDRTDPRTQVLQDVSIAVRNEIAYRLTDRGVFPEDTWWTERYDADE